MKIFFSLILSILSLACLNGQENKGVVFENLTYEQSLSKANLNDGPVTKIDILRKRGC